MQRGGLHLRRVPPRLCVGCAPGGAGGEGGRSGGQLLFAGTPEELAVSGVGHTSSYLSQMLGVDK